MVKICIGICGLKRCVDLVIYNIDKLFCNYEYDYYLCLSNKNETEYNNNVDINKLLNNDKIKQLLFIKDNHNDQYRNCLNYYKKVVNIIKLINREYDYYIIIRSDFIFENINFFEYITDDKIYLSDQCKNDFVIDRNNKTNEQIIITKNYDQLSLLSKVYEYALENNDYCEIVFHDYLKFNKIDHKLINIKYKLVLSKCNIIAIAGDSGSGKSTLLKYLEPIFNNNVLKLETDRYHKWERDDDNYKNYTHLNPYANYLEKMNDDVYNLKIGNEIYTVDYDHNTGKFTKEKKIDTNDQIILCGLHTLLSNKLNEIINLKIYMDTDRELIKKWKIKRDVEKRGYSIEKVLDQIKKRDDDYKKYIVNQKHNSDLIINFYENNDKLRCKIGINNKKFWNKLTHYFIKYNYKVNYIGQVFYVELKNSVDDLINEINKLIIVTNELNDYYNELLMIILLCIY